MHSADLGNWIETVRNYVAKDARLGILAACLGLGLAIWLLDVFSGLLVRKIPLDDRQRAQLALGAPYFTVQGFREGDLAGLRPLGRLRVRWLLRKDWGIRDGASAVDRLNGLLQSGHRSDPRLRDPDQPAADLEIVDRALLAWDAIRVVFLARCCFAVGYLDEPTLWAAVRGAIQLARPRFRSWQEWGRSFAAGRAIWSGGESSYYETVVEKLLSEPKSVWNRVPWEIATQP